VSLQEAIKDTWNVVVLVESKNVRVVEGIIYKSAETPKKA